MDRNNKVDMSYMGTGNSMDMDKECSIPEVWMGSHTLIGFSCYRHSLQ